MTPRWATLSPHEREEDEAERLVRPAPKVKPPRRDHRRETVESEDDPDEDSGSDGSLNYKTIGGSIAQRVAAEWIRVRNREKDVVTRVSPETLKETPELYEKVPENEPQRTRGIRRPRLPEKPEKPHYHKEHIPHPEWPDPRPLPPKPLQPLKRAKPPKRVPVPVPPKPEKPPKPKPPGWVWERRQAIVDRFLASFAEPSFVKEATGKMVRVRKKDTGWVGEVSEDTLREDASAYEPVDTEETDKAKNAPGHPPEAPQGVSQGEPPPWAQQEDKPQQEPPETPSGKKPKKTRKPKKPVQEESGKPVQEESGKPVQEESGKPAQEESEPESEPKPKKEKPESKPKKEPKPSKASEEALWRRSQAMIHLIPLLGVDGALEATRNGVNPDNMGEFSRAYTASKRSGIGGDVGAHLDEVRSYFDERGEVKDPVYGVSDKGRRTPWEKLSPDEKDRNREVHKAKVLGLKAALGASLSTTLNARGIPESYGPALSGFVLQGRKNPEHAALSAFQQRLTSGRIEPVPTKRAMRFIQSLSDPRDQKVAAAQYQAGVFQQLQQDFLDSPQGLSEHNSAEDIIKSLRQARDFLRERDVPEDLRSIDLTGLLRERALRKLRSISGQEVKADLVQGALDEEDARDYETAKARWEREEVGREKAREKARKAREKARERYRKEVRQDFLKEHPMGVLEPDVVEKQVDERLRDAGLHEDDDVKSPPKPKPPVNYYSTLPDKVQRQESRKLMRELANSMGPVTKTASAVAARWGAYSTCFPGGVMAQPTRTAVYWGVEPPPVRPYPEWSQAQDLTDADYAVILREAAKWLPKYRDAIPDVRCRAALDLAIRTVGEGKYSARVTAPEYNSLLAKLLKVPSEGTLLTQHTARESPYIPAGTGTGDTTMFDKKQADATLARLDKLAATIQAKHADWGMPFEQAREIVNAIDKTADEIETAAFGKDSLQRRQVEILRQAKVIQQDADEGYMGTFNAPSAPHQVDADEPYMSLYRDDQSTAVNEGKSSVGRPLAP